MRRFQLIVLVILLVPSSVMVLAAQSSVQSQRGYSPTAALITVSSPDAQGIVTITGATGAVFPGAQVAIRNLFTEEVVYTQAGLTGTFSARLYGPGNTPFWISPAVSIPNEIRNQPGSMPGGPGTIIYGTDTRPPSELKPVTQLLIDGQVDDWSAYPESLLLKGVAQSVYGLHNDESLYIAVTSPLDSYWKMRVEFTLEGASYELMLDPRLSTEPATWRRTAPTEQDLGSLAVATTQADVVEMRIPFVSLSATLGVALEFATMEQVEFLDAEGSPLRTVTVAQPLLAVDEIDGPMVAAQSRMEDGVNFTLSGPVAQGAAHWHARGQINTLNAAPGDRLHLQMDVTLNAPDMPDLLVGMKMIGTLSLQPITDAQGQAVVGGLYSNNGWSAVKTYSGMPVDNLRSDFVLDETLVPAPQVLRRGDDLIFALDFDLELPSDLRAGTYGLIFKGAAQMGDDAPFDWTDNSLLGQGPGISPVQISRLPVILTVGDVSNARRLIWSLFVDQPSEGSRGVLADEDQDRVGLSNRIRYNSPTYILSPFSDPAGRNPRSYPLEPYLMNLMPNTYESTAAPLIPFSLPGGQISVRVTRPDGTVDDLGQVPITQNRLSTAEMDDRRLFGGQSQVDVYRLTSSNPAFRSYVFDQYGPYTIRMAGSVEDIWGNHYEGGGTYHVLAAEMLDMQPGVLSGTPFEVGDVFYPGLQISPGAAANVRVSMRLYPLDGSPVIEQTIEGKANDFGYFAPADSGFNFDVPGEYVVDYEARFSDLRQRLWAGSLRGAGVVASPDSAMIAHGQRGLNGYYPKHRPGLVHHAQLQP